MRDVEFAVLDLEMTGLSPERDRICEVAVIRGRLVGRRVELSTLVRPEVPMTPGAIACTGITDALLADAPRFDQIAAEVADALDGAVVVGHNIVFDMGFLHRECEHAGRRVAPPFTLDTLLMARRLFSFPRNKLLDVCAALGVKVAAAHRALADARATFDVLERMIDALDPSQTLTVGELSDLVDALAPNSPLRLRQQKVLREAFRDRVSVRIDYVSSSEPASGVVSREVSIWFLRLPKVQGWCHLRGGERVFRVDRMRNVARGERSYVIPNDAVSRI